MIKKCHVTRLDKFGRVRLPSASRSVAEDASVSEVFVTSVDDRTIQIYQLMAWYELLDKMPKTKKVDPLLRKFLMKANYNGHIVRVDRFGRIQIPGFLRQRLKLEGEIKIEENEDRLELMPTRG